MIANNATQTRGFFGRTDKSIDPDIARLCGAVGGELVHRRRIAGVPQICVIERGEHGDGENTQTAFARVHCRLHHLRISMDSEEGCAQSRNTLHARRYRIADVMEFQIEENALAGLDQLWRIIEPAGKGQLIADLVERHGIAQARDHGLRRFD